MVKASDKYRNWFDSDKLVSDLMDQAADDIDERDAEIERLREALKDKDELIQYLEGHIDGLKKFVVQQKESE